MSSTKREHSQADESSSSKRAKLDVSESSLPYPNCRVVLNPADCNLDFNIEGNGLQGHALYQQGFAYCWSGARANVGITGGKYCFGCKIISDQPVDMDDVAPDQQHVSRIGISRGDDTVGNLGETEHSFGFGGTGKFSSGGRFSDYGTKFGRGDTIVCSVDLENKPWGLISFSKNGKCLGTAKHFDAGPGGLRVVNSPMSRLQWESTVFPHILLKNVVVEVQFSIEDGLVPQEGYKPWASALVDGNAIMGPTFSKLSDCEVIMMVGLPASGKTTWAERRLKEHPERRYVLLGTNLALDQMKVPGLLRKNNYGERFDRLMDRATGIFNTLLTRASKTPRNFIIDQTNVYKNARKRKLKPFASFRKIAVVVFPNPEELKVRADKRSKEMGKEVPADAINSMIANYVLPMSKDMRGSDEYFDKVDFVELDREESQRYLDDMKRALGSVSNTNSKGDFSPCPSQTSDRSYISPTSQNRESSSVSCGPRGSFHSPVPPLNYDYHEPPQVNSSLSGGLQSYHSPEPRDYPRETYSGYDRSSLSRNGSDYNGAYRGYENPRGPNVNSMGDFYSGGNIGSRNSVAGDVIDPYRNSTSGYYGSYESPVGSARSSSFADPSYGVGQPGYPLANPYNPSPTSYGAPYGTSTRAPYGTPMPRPPYGNFPADTQRNGGGGYGGPHTGYY